MARRLLWAVWMLCAASIAATFAMAIYEAAHPLIDPGYLKATIFVVPYVVVGATASVLRRRPAWLALLLVGTALTATIGTWLRYENLRLGIDILEARAEGQRLMFCVPPPIFFALPLEYSLAVAAAGVASLRWLFGGGR